MSPRRPAAELSALPLLAATIEFGGAVIVVIAVARTLRALATGASIEQARLLMIAGVLGALGFKTAATLLKTIELGTWNSIATFAAIFGLRTMIKQLFVWERARLTASRHAPPTRAPIRPPPF